MKKSNLSNLCNGLVPDRHFIAPEFRRVRDEIAESFTAFAKDIKRNMA